MRGIKSGVALAAAAALAMGMAGCSEKKDDSIADKAKDDKKLVIGVKYDQPGLGLKSGAGVEGFDVDVAKYVAKKLGVEEKGIEFKESASANRESFLANGTVDLVIATYSITEKRLPKVTYGGPYVVTHQDIMVRADDNSIKTFEDLKGKKICAVQGSNSWKNITEGTNKLNKKVDVKTVPVQRYEECMTKLKGKSLDVVTTDATILAGFAAREGGAVKVVNAPFTDEKYGVGIKKGDKKGCEAVNKAITEMYSDGSMKQLWEKWFGAAKLPFVATQPPAEGCP